MTTARSRSAFNHDVSIPVPASGTETGDREIILNRRQLIAIAGLTGAGLALSGAASAIPNITGESTRVSALAVSDLEYERFLEMVGESFVVRARQANGSTREASLVLSDVTTIVPAGAGRAGELRAQPFSLLFSLESGTLNESGIMQFRHPELGKLDLFIHQVGMSSGAAGVTYEASFN